MKKALLHLILVLSLFKLQAQSGQLSINRIEQMPDLPFPLELRDWKAVAAAYDNYVFDMDKTGQYLPLSRTGSQGQFNYPDNIPLFMDSYVGAAAHANQAEAINIIPAIVGASLIGIDKSNQNGQNWVEKNKDFFNLKNGQNVYLNNYFTSSGNDWWYDLMPNLYFFQLRSLYPTAVPEFDSQFLTVADRWLWAVRQLGGSTTPWQIPDMNYRAFNLATGQPLATGVPEPESAGSIAWLLYTAFLETGERKYMEGTQLALDFLAGWQTNPSYELQLPYGTLTAARLNAMEGTNYPLQKFLDWCFDRGALRGWGAIVGNWGGYDVSGLIGEANDGGNDYAFVMNGFQQAAALAPLPKYDKRYAKAISKWLLNLTNASRLFYRDALPQANQDSYIWSSVNDPEACIPYEAMKEKWEEKTPFATGDAIRGGWAATNLSLYSGSSVGYLAAVVSETNVPEILQINLNITDFYGDNDLIGYMYFNPAPETKTVQISLPGGTYGMYEAITETVSEQYWSDMAELSIPAGETRLVRFFPRGNRPEARDGKLYIDNKILDYHYQYDYTLNIRIKALSVSQNPVLTNADFMAYCESGNLNPEDAAHYSWYLNETVIPDVNGSTAQLIAPAEPGKYILKCVVSANGQSVQDTLHIRVVDHIPVAPVVEGIITSNSYTAVNESNTFTVKIVPAPDEILEYEWSVSSGSLSQNNENSVTWQAPSNPGVESVTVKVTNQDQLSTTVTANLLVKDLSFSAQQPLIWYPFDTDNRNMAVDRFHATVNGASKTDDPRGEPSAAYRFTSGSNIIYTENHNDLNFEDAVSLSCWVKLEQFGSERYIISHGSWHQRYKLSVTPEGFLRWTVKTSNGVSDLDSSEPIKLNHYYHVTALYTGYSMELYIDGSLDVFKAFYGAIQPSTKPLTIGRMDNTETLYALRGSVDEVKLWDKEIPAPQIEQLKNQWATPSGIEETDIIALIYPNPADGYFIIKYSDSEKVSDIILTGYDSRQILSGEICRNDHRIEVHLPEMVPGLYIVTLILDNGRRVNWKLMVK
ncbi:MAG TPA: laminin G [Bacteroidales bacterium]|jgi:hypothetical protein|nr:hypothetical protein [Bacteroidales bacterium]MBP8709327.1 hypothetical protein [Bacteroidales bacterium]HHV00429.1 laminin G [Bacteroidales bacterium]